jgi:hypothetical protein
MSIKIALGIPEELNELILKACSITGRSRNAACTDWLLKGVLEEMAMLEKTGLIDKEEIKKLMRGSSSVSINSTVVTPSLGNGITENSDFDHEDQ